MKLKKMHSVVLAGALTAILLAGCGGDEKSPAISDTPQTGATGSEEESGNKAQEVKTESKSLTVMFQTSWMNAGTQAAFDTVARSMNVKFEFEELPDGDAGQQLILAKMSSGEVPDILWWQSASMTDALVGAEKFDDLSGDWQQYYDKDTIASRYYIADGKLIEAPFGDAVVFGMCYNKKVFAENGVEIPTTWGELLTACKVFKEKGIIPVYLSGKDSWTLQIMALDSFSKENKRTGSLIEDIESHKLLWENVDSAELTLSRMMDLVDSGYVQETYLSDTYADAQNALLDNEAAMYPQASWIAPELAKLTDDQEALDNLGMFVIPNDDPDAVAAYQPPTGMMLPSAGKNKELAKQVIFALTGPEAATALYETQPGIPFIAGVDGHAIGIQKDASAIINSGRISGLLGLNYDYSNDLPSLIQDMFIGNKDAKGVLRAIDDVFAAQARDAKDPHWN